LKRIDKSYPIFVLGGVVIDRAHVRDIVEPDMNQFKMRYFGRDDVILHTVDMGSGTGSYAFLADPTIRAKFYEDLNAMLLRWDYKVIACVIKKPELVDQFGTNAQDPYMHCLHVLVERFCQELGEELDTGFICAEKRGRSFDYDLMQAWEKLRTQGTPDTLAIRIDSRIVALDLRDKKPNLAGMQLADLVITPIGRHVMEMAPKPNQV
jgi:hypothetical protein